MARYYISPGVTGPRFMYTSWHAGQGGVMPGMVHSPPSSLGNADLVESGLHDPIFEPYPALARARDRLCKLPQSAPCNLRANAAAAMSGVVDQIGQDLGAIPIWSGLSTNEKTLAVIGAGALAWWWMNRRGRRGRRNPWAVTARSRGVTGTIHFTSKKLAKEYEGYLRKANKRPRLRYTRK